eukprot:jgi/Botrbrau1/21564/Bobra.174_2s0062.1
MNEPTIQTGELYYEEGRAWTMRRYSCTAACWGAPWPSCQVRDSAWQHRGCEGPGPGIRCEDRCQPPGRMGTRRRSQTASPSWERWRAPCHLLPCQLSVMTRMMTMSLKLSKLLLPSQSVSEMILKPAGKPVASSRIKTGPSTGTQQSMRQTSLFWTNRQWHSMQGNTIRFGACWSPSSALIVGPRDAGCLAGGIVHWVVGCCN